MTSHNIGSVIEKYNNALSTIDPKCQNLEFEAKISDLSRGDFVTFLDRINKSDAFDYVGIETTINCISTHAEDASQKSSYIQTHNFIGAKRESTIHYKKSPVGSKFNVNSGIMRYSLSTNIENKCIAEASQFNAILRFKTRVTFRPVQVSGWRYDLTLVKQVRASDYNKERTVGTIEELFVGLKYAPEYRQQDISSIIDRTNGLNDMKYELEIERTDNSSTLNENELSQVMTLLWNTYDNSSETDSIYASVLREINGLISSRILQGKLTLKNILNQAISMTRNDYYTNVYPPSNYYITDKADGLRALVYINAGKLHFITKDIVTLECPGVDQCLIDCEYITNVMGEHGKTNKNDKSLLGIFDVLIANGKKVLGEDISGRMSYANDIAKACAHILEGINIKLFVKEYVQVGNPIEEAFLKVRNVKRPYHTDGLILTMSGKPYFETKNYKWKPNEDNTIDFLVRKCPSNLLGTKPHNIIPGKQTYILFVGISNIKRQALGIIPIAGSDEMFPRKIMTGPYYPIQFTSSLDPYAYIYYGDDKVDLDGRICEFSIGDLKDYTTKRRNGKDPEIFILNRIRDDRSFDNGEYGNDYEIAEKIFSSTIDPFTFESLWKSNTGYFERSRDVIYRANNKFKRFIIKELFERFIQKGTVVYDLAAGRGADLELYYARSISRLLAIDIDPTALVELIRRNIDLQTRHARDKHYRGLKLSAMVANISNGPQTITGMIEDRFALKYCDVIVCNYAFHYVCITKRAAENTLSLMYDALSPGGHAIITVMDGGKVHKLLADVETDNSWVLIEDNVEKYKIRKEYGTNDKLADFGQEISVKLPMASELYREPLCNITAVTDLAKDLGFSVLQIVEYGSRLPAFAVENKSIAAELTVGDKEYASLHCAIVLHKPEEKKKTGGRFIR